MNHILQILEKTIINDFVNSFYNQIKLIVPNIFIVESQMPCWNLDNLLLDSLLVKEIGQINIQNLSSRLSYLQYIASSNINFNQDLLMFYLIVSTSNDIIIKNNVNNNKILLLSIDNINKQSSNISKPLGLSYTPVATTVPEIITIGVIKYNMQTIMLQMNINTGELLINSQHIEFLDIIKNILSN